MNPGKTLRGWLDFSAASRALRHRDFAIFMAGNAARHIGIWAQRLAVGWLSWELTGSAFWVAVIVAANFMPSLLAGPIGGVLADRLDRLKLVLLCQGLSVAQALMLCFLAAIDGLTIGWLAALTVGHGLLVGLNQPARKSIVPNLVPKHDLPAAIAITAITFNAARFVGPMIAGVIIAGYGVLPAFLLNALGFLCAMIALCCLTLPRRDGSTRRRIRVVKDLKTGVRYAAGHFLIGPLLLLAITISLLLQPVNALLPAVAETFFGRGPSGLATLVAARGVGALAASLLLARRSRSGGLSLTVLYGLLVASVSVGVLVGLHSFWVAVASLAVFGFAMTCIGVGSSTLLQVSVDDHVRGRVVSLQGVMRRIGPAAGALMMGAAADGMGLQWPLAAGAALALVLFVPAMLWERRLRPVIAGRFGV